MASVVIPAYNEAQVLTQCLKAVEDELLLSDYTVEVVVVANGCVDSTVDVARSRNDTFARLEVLDLPQAGKIGALNAGDLVADRFPRIYLDADIVLRDGALRGLIDVLDTPSAVVAAPSVRFDTTGASWSVRAFYRVYSLMPYVTDGLIGLGVYGVSQAGRERFGAFPDVTADDLYVQEMFSPSERLRARGYFVVRVPQRWSDLVSVRSRGARGKAELARLGITAHALDTTATAPGTALRQLLRQDPRRVFDVAIYILVTVAARRRAKRVSERWARDESTRHSSAPPGEV